MSESSCTALLSGLGTMDLDVCFYSFGFSLRSKKGSNAEAYRSSLVRAKGHKIWQAGSASVARCIWRDPSKKTSKKQRPQC